MITLFVVIMLGIVAVNVLSEQTLARTSLTTKTYNLAGNQLHFENTLDINSSVSNVTTITYNYCADDYITSDWARQTLKLSPGLFSLMILAAGLAGAYVLFEGMSKEK